jgi:hypothetical protein
MAGRTMAGALPQTQSAVGDKDPLLHSLQVGSFKLNYCTC